MSRRILQVVLSLTPGGTERLVLDLVTRLNAELPMAVCCLDAAGTWGEALKRTGVPVTALGRKAGFHPRLAGAVARAARDHQADVLHCHQYSPFVYGCLSRLWRPRSRVIFTEHGRLSDAPPSHKRRRANAVLSRLPQGVFAVSDDLRRHMVDEGFPEWQVKTIHNGIEIAPPAVPEERDGVRRELGISTDTLVVVAVARLDPVKDLASLIEAMGLVVRRVSAVLLVIGDGPERRALEAAALASPIAAATRFLGHREDARRWLRGCDVYVNCSISEGVSLTILEAMSAALPVVATEVGGTPEVVDARVGRLVPARSPEALADAILALAADPPARARLGRAARERASERFSIERMVRDYREVYLQA